MHEQVVIAVAAVLVGGVAAQWIGWRLRIPAIIFLLLGGLVAGPITGLLRPDEIFGDLLFPSVSMAVAVILFEGALGLGWSGLRVGGQTVWRLLSMGALVTLTGTALAAHALLGVSWNLAALIAGVLVVTGPTVVGPIVQAIGLHGRVGPILEAEGTLIDPIGAVLTVLVFQAAYESTEGIGSIIGGIAATMLVGAAVGLAIGGLLLVLLAHYVIPDQLHNVTTLAAVIGAFATANAIRAESGLVAVTIMGIALASQHRVPVTHVLEFNETLRILFISGLFVLLAARVDLDTLRSIEWRNLAFLAVLVLVVRPACVLVSTVGSDLSREERLFLAATAPRGIVAAAVASIFSLRLSANGVDESQVLLSATLTVIVGTVLLSGLGSRRLAARLDLIDVDEDRLVILGANSVGRMLASALEQQGVHTSVIDLDRRELAAARMDGLATQHGSVFADTTWADAGIQRATGFVALTPNDELNTLATRHAASVIGRDRVFQLPPSRPEHEAWWTLPAGAFARPAFANDATHERLAELVERGWTTTATRLTEKFDREAYDATHPDAVVMFTVATKGGVTIHAVDSSRRIGGDDIVVALNPPHENAPNSGTRPTSTE